VPAERRVAPVAADQVHPVENTIGDPRLEASVLQGLPRVATS
jgi:hypothetical protein